MPRRSFRLVTNGYYNPDDETDRSISYRERLFRVFKRKTGNRHISHNVTPGSANNSNSTENQSGGPSHPLRTKSEPIMRTVTPPSSQSQKQRSMSSPILEKSSYPRLCRLASHLGPSSGYSSSGEMHSSSGIGLRRSSGMKKACVVALPLIILLAWFFSPLLSSFICNSCIETLTSAPPQPNTPVFNPGVVEAAVARIRNLEARQAKLIDELSTLSQKYSTSPSPSPDHSLLTSDLQQALEKWLDDRIKMIGHPVANKMVDFALETLGATVITTRSSVTYRSRAPYVGLPGFPLWYLTESPQTVIQGNPVLAGKCWPFCGNHGSLVISLSYPIKITHVTLDHLPRYNSPTGTIASAPRDFEVYGLKDDSDEGTHLGTFTYDENGTPTQTFKIPPFASDEVYRAVEMRVLSNWGKLEYTCLYRFRVHGKINT